MDRCFAIGAVDLVALCMRWADWGFERFYRRRDTFEKVKTGKISG